MCFIKPRPSQKHRPSIEWLSNRPVDSTKTVGTSVVACRLVLNVCARMDLLGVPWKCIYGSCPLGRHSSNFGHFSNVLRHLNAQSSLTACTVLASYNNIIYSYPCWWVRNLHLSMFVWKWWRVKNCFIFNWFSDKISIFV
jgi:hypothetical protein